MSAADLLGELQSLGVHVEADGDHLRYFAPAGAVPAALRARIAARRADVIAALRGRRSTDTVSKLPRAGCDWPMAPPLPRRGRGDVSDVQPGDVCCAAADREAEP